MKKAREDKGTSKPFNPIIRILLRNKADVNYQDCTGSTALHYACQRGNINAVKELFLSEEYAKRDLVDTDGTTPLLLAAQHGHTDIIRILLTQGANIKIMNKMGMNSIFYAAASTEMNIVQCLVTHCKNINSDMQNFLKQPNSLGNNAYKCAALANRPNILQYLLELGPYVEDHEKKEIASMAAEKNFVEIFKVIMDYQNLDNYNIMSNDTWNYVAHLCTNKDAIEILRLALPDDPDERDYELMSYNKDGCIPIHLAASRNAPKCLQHMLQCSESTYRSDNNERTILYLAVRSNSYVCTQMILESEAVEYLINRGDANGVTPISVACGKGYVDIIKLLQKYDAKFNIQDDKGDWPITKAANQGHLQVLNYVNEFASDLCDMYVVDTEGSTVLILATINNHIACVEFILSKFPDIIDMRSNDKKSALDHACSKGRLRIAKLLVLHKAALEDSKGNAPDAIIHAADNGRSDLFRFILNSGGMPQHRISHGLNNIMLANFNALDVAIARENKGIVYEILKSSFCLECLRNCIPDSEGFIDTPMRKLIKKMPDVALYAMEKCITANGKHPEHEDFELTFRFEMINDTYASWCAPKKEKSDLGDFADEEEDSEDEDGFTNTTVIGKNAQPYSQDIQVLLKNHPLYIIAEEGDEEMMTHALSNSLLEQKWRTYASWFYGINLTLYSFFLLFLTHYILAHKPPSELLIDKKLNRKNFDDVCNDMLQNDVMAYYGSITFSKYMLIVFMAINMMKEIYQLITMRLKYFLEFDNIVELTIYSLTIAIVIDVSSCARQIDLRTEWQWQLCAAVIFLAWVNLVLFGQKLSFYGIYIIMFLSVTVTFLRFIMLFSLFVLAFGFTFYTLLVNQTAFNSIPNAVLKSGVMMIGELDYSAIFNDRFEDPQLGNFVVYPNITYFVFVVFIILMCVIIMNLLSGLAIRDISAVLKTCASDRMAMRIHLALQVEAKMPMWFRRKHEILSTTLKPNYQPKTPKEFVIQFFRSLISADLPNLENIYSTKEPNLVTKEEESLNELSTRMEQLQNYELKIENSLKDVTSRLQKIRHMQECHEHSHHSEELDQIKDQKRDIFNRLTGAQVVQSRSATPFNELDGDNIDISKISMDDLDKV